MAHPLRLDLAYLLESMKIRSHHPYYQLLLTICSFCIILERKESTRRCKHGQHQGWMLYLSSSTGWLRSRRKHRGLGSKDTSRWGVRHDQLSSTRADITHWGRKERYGGEKLWRAVKVKTNSHCLAREGRETQQRKKQGKEWPDWNSKVVLSSFIFLFPFFSCLPGATLVYWGRAVVPSWALAALGANPQRAAVLHHAGYRLVSSCSTIIEKQWKCRKNFPDVIFLHKPCPELLTRMPWGTKCRQEESTCPLLKDSLYYEILTPNTLVGMVLGTEVRVCFFI